MEPILFNYLKDKTAEVRDSCGEKIGSLIKVLKNEWVINKFVPKLQECLNKEYSYL